MRNLYCIMGKSGSGKTTLVEELEKKYGLRVIQSYTTRPPRYKGETGHIFVSKEEFDALGELCAYNVFDGYEYGVTLQQIEDNDIYVVDPSGVLSLYENYKGNKKIFSFALSVDADVLVSRMIARGDKEDKIITRLINDATQFENLFPLADVILDGTRPAECVCEDVFCQIKQFENPDLDIQPIIKKRSSRCLPASEYLSKILRHLKILRGNTRKYDIVNQDGFLGVNDKCISLDRAILYFTAAYDKAYADLNEDKFYFDYANERVTWMYYNPDSFVGGQFVTVYIPFEIIENMGNKEIVFSEFSDYVCNCRQELNDINTEYFAGAREDFNKPADFIGIDFKTIQEMIFAIKSYRKDICLSRTKQEIAAIKGEISNLRHELDGAAIHHRSLISSIETRLFKLMAQLEAFELGMDLRFYNLIDLDHLDSFWYGGKIATIEYNGYIISIEASGNIFANITTNNGVVPFVDCDNNGVYKNTFINDLVKNDRHLYELISKKDIELLKNNWFKYTIFDERGREIKNEPHENMLENNLFDVFSDMAYFKNIFETVKVLFNN